MPSTTPDDQTADDSGTPRAVPAESTEAGRAGTSAQGSGKQFERGTESVPGQHDPDATAGPAAGPGASASGKRFARGTDSDGDGQTYDQA